MRLRVILYENKRVQYIIVLRFCPFSSARGLLGYKPGIWSGAGCGILMWLRQRGRLGKLGENGYAERLIRTIKAEEVFLSDYKIMADARKLIGHFIDEVYRHERIHSALDYLTPAEVEEGWRRNTPSTS